MNWRSVPLGTVTVRGKKSLKLHSLPAGTADGMSAMIVTGPEAAATGTAASSWPRIKTAVPAAPARHRTLTTSTSTPDECRFGGPSSGRSRSLRTSGVLQSPVGVHPEQGQVFVHGALGHHCPGRRHGGVDVRLA